MTLAILTIATFAVFLILDGLMLTLVMKPLFTRHIGPLMAEPLRMAPAAVIGAMAYGTYEFTSYAILRDWHWTMLVTDTVWGTVLTAVSAWAGLAITRAVTA